MRLVPLAGTLLLAAGILLDRGASLRAAPLAVIVALTLTLRRFQVT